MTRDELDRAQVEAWRDRANAARLRIDAAVGLGFYEIERSATEGWAAYDRVKAELVRVTAERDALRAGAVAPVGFVPVNVPPPPPVPPTLCQACGEAHAAGPCPAAVLVKT
jgi:hypothetical protein